MSQLKIGGWQEIPLNNLIPLLRTAIGFQITNNTKGANAIDIEVLEANSNCWTIHQPAKIIEPEYTTYYIAVGYTWFGSGIKLKIGNEYITIQGQVGWNGFTKRYGTVYKIGKDYSVKDNTSNYEFQNAPLNEVLKIGSHKLLFDSYVENPKMKIEIAITE